MAVWAFQHETTPSPTYPLSRCRLSTARSTNHVVAAADKSRDAAKKSVAGRSLVKFNVLGSQALDHHFHDLRDNVPDLIILELVSLKIWQSHTGNLAYMRVDALQNSIEPGHSLLKVAVQRLRNDCTS